jgi:hypothetical protein
MTRLTASDGVAEDNFGTSVSISKDASTIVIGADGYDVNTTITNAGAAYLFRSVVTNSSMAQSATPVVELWTQVGKFVAADPDTNAYLGSSIAVDENIVVVGAPWDNDKSGSVYVVDTGFLSGTPTPTDQPVAPTPQLPTTLSPTIGVIEIAMFVAVGGVLAVAWIVFTLFRRKRRQRQNQQQHASMNTEEPILSPPTPTMDTTPNDFTATLFGADEIPIMVANAVPMSSQASTEPVEDRTIEAEAFLDPATSVTAAGTRDRNLMSSEPPGYKDQAWTVLRVTPSAPPSSTPSSETSRNR